MQEGFITIHRKILDWYGFQSGNRLKLWITILVLASHKDKTMMYNGKPKEIKRGQFVSSRRSLARITGISESYVENLLKELEIQQQIQQQSCSSSRLITILNYDIHQNVQPRKQPRTGQQKDHGQDTINNVNNETISNTNVLLSKFKELYYKKFNHSYLPVFPKDPAVLKGIAKQCDEAHIIDLMELFFDSTDSFIMGSNYGVGVFGSE